eukprot:615510-Rhodomonas_salina.2
MASMSAQGWADESADGQRTQMRRCVRRHAATAQTAHDQRVARTALSGAGNETDGEGRAPVWRDSPCRSASSRPDRCVLVSPDAFQSAALSRPPLPRLDHRHARCPPPVVGRDRSRVLEDDRRLRLVTLSAAVVPHLPRRALEFHLADRLEQRRLVQRPVLRHPDPAHGNGHRPHLCIEPSEAESILHEISK